MSWGLFLVLEEKKDLASSYGTPSSPEWNTQKGNKIYKERSPFNREVSLSYAAAFEGSKIFQIPAEMAAPNIGATMNTQS